MKVKVAAKINLLLDVLGVLPDGYHSLSMVMQSVDCCDIITVNRTNTEKIILKSQNTKMPLDETNIAYKAAQIFFEKTKLQNTGLEIEIEKHIPMRQGLPAAVPTVPAFCMP